MFKFDLNIYRNVFPLYKYREKVHEKRGHGRVYIYDILI